ncbi:MAG: hypothetical protein EH224_13580 [Calditrichaeota bacterium]|nr:MAG: hypothetical protein EH224_13580 [Calditrichota bacterium]
MPTTGIKHSGFGGLRALQPATTFVTVNIDAARTPLNLLPATVSTIFPPSILMKIGGDNFQNFRQERPPFVYGFPGLIIGFPFIV